MLLIEVFCTLKVQGNDASVDSLGHCRNLPACQDDPPMMLALPQGWALICSKHFCIAGCSLRQVISSGESLTWQLAEQLQSALPRARLLNIYGCCEIGADSTFYDFTAAQPLDVPISMRKGSPMQQRQQHHHHIQPSQQDDEHFKPASDLCMEPPRISASRQSSPLQARPKVVPKYVPTGRPLPSVSVRIMQQTAAEAAHGGTASNSIARPETEVLLPSMAESGCEGEVWVAGPGVAAGYLGETELTAARFVRLPPSVTGSVEPQGQPQSPRCRSHSQQQWQEQQQAPLPVHSTSASALSTTKMNSSHTKTAACIGEDNVTLAPFPAGRAVNSLPPPDGSSMPSKCASGSSQEMPGSFSSAATEKAGWKRFFRSGDLGYMDTGTGFLHITGRTDSQVKIRGAGHFRRPCILVLSIGSAFICRGSDTDVGPPACAIFVRCFVHPSRLGSKLVFGSHGHDSIATHLALAVALSCFVRELTRNSQDATSQCSHIFQPLRRFEGLVHPLGLFESSVNVVGV